MPVKKRICPVCVFYVSLNMYKQVAKCLIIQSEACAERIGQRSKQTGNTALGADGKQMARMVIAQGMALTVIGLATGLVAALAGSHVMASVLFGVGPRDLVTFGSVPLVLGTVALLACALPALRATRVDPMKALRSE